jgi:hypothetical protein
MQQFELVEAADQAVALTFMSLSISLITIPHAFQDPSFLGYEAVTTVKFQFL